MSLLIFVLQYVRCMGCVLLFFIPVVAMFFFVNAVYTAEACDSPSSDEGPAVLLNNMRKVGHGSRVVCSVLRHMRITNGMQFSPQQAHS